MDVRMRTWDQTVAEQLERVAPLVKESGPWGFVGRDDRGWLLFEPADDPSDLLTWGGEVVRTVRKALSRIAVTPLYFRQGIRVEGQPFMEVTFR